MATSPASRRWRRALIYLAVVAVAVPAAIELGARAIYAVRFENAAYLGYPRGAPVTPDALAVTIDAPISERRGVLAPGTHPLYVDGELLHTLEINETGFRGRDIHAPQEARRRIVALGGSSTFSSECPDGQTYPDRLQAVIDADEGPGSVEVLNMGMIGYSLVDVAQLFTHTVVPNRPDLVTLCSAFNDAISARLLDVRPGIGGLSTRALWGRSLFYTVLYNRLAARRHADEPWAATRDRYERLLGEMVALGRRHGVPLLFVLQPLADIDRLDAGVLRERLARRGEGELERLRRSYEATRAPQAELCEVMRATAERDGVPWVDPRAAMTDVPDPETYFFAFLHLTPAGSQRMAEAIWAEIREKYGGLEGVIEAAD